MNFESSGEFEDSVYYKKVTSVTNLALSDHV